MLLTSGKVQNYYPYRSMIVHDIDFASFEIHTHHSWRKCKCGLAVSIREVLNMADEIDPPAAPVNQTTSSSEPVIVGSLDEQIRLAGPGATMDPERYKKLFIDNQNLVRSMSLDQKLNKLHEMQEAIKDLRVGEQAVYLAYAEDLENATEAVREEQRKKDRTYRAKVPSEIREKAKTEQTTDKLVQMIMKQMPHMTVEQAQNWIKGTTGKK